MSHSEPSVHKSSNKRELNPAQHLDIMKVATNNVTGIENTHEFATRPLLSASECSKNIQSSPEVQTKDQLGILFHWNMPLYMANSYLIGGIFNQLIVLSPK